MTDDDEEFNDAAFFLIEVHDDLGEPKEQLGIEMERVCILYTLINILRILIITICIPVNQFCSIFNFPLMQYK